MIKYTMMIERQMRNVFNFHSHNFGCGYLKFYDCVLIVYIISIAQCFCGTSNFRHANVIWFEPRDGHVFCEVK